MLPEHQELVTTQNFNFPIGTMVIHGIFESRQLTKAEVYLSNVSHMSE